MNERYVEQNKNEKIQNYQFPSEREFSPEKDVDPSIKLGSKVTHILIEMPDEMKATSVEVRHATSDLISSTPWSESITETSKLSGSSDGEYHGGDIDRIAARSGVDVDVVRAAAAESIRRQRGDS